MNATNLLVPPAPGNDTRDSRQKALWAATHERMERFLPGFLADVLPPPPSPPTPAPVPAPTSVPEPPIVLPVVEPQAEPQPTAADASAP